MAIKTHRISAMAGTDEVFTLLNFLQHPDKVGERLKMLEKARCDLNKAVDRYVLAQEMDDLRNEIVGLEAKRDSIVTENDTLISEMRKAKVRIVQEANLEADRILREAEGRNLASLERERDALKRETEVQEREQAVTAQRHGLQHHDD